MSSVIYKAWCVTSVVSVLQFLLGIGLYWLFGSVAIAAATVGFCTFVALFPVIEGAVPEYCQKMERVLIAAASAAFAVAAAALAARYYQQMNGYLGEDFSLTVLFIVITFLLVITILSGILLTSLGYQKFGNIQEQESPPGTIVTFLLPAGLGLVFGGAILLYRQLYRQWQRFRETAG